MCLSWHNLAQISQLKACEVGGTQLDSVVRFYRLLTNSIFQLGYNNDALPWEGASQRLTSSRRRGVWKA